MHDSIPLWLSIFFLFTAILTLILFFYSNNKPKKALLVILAIVAIQSFLAYSGFYLVLDGFPPRIAAVLLPSALLIIYGLLPKQREWIYNNRNIKISTYLHTVRILVEFALLQLFLCKTVPQLMTFEGRNFDIIIGITAPIVAYLYSKNKLSDKGLLTWNVIGLLFVLFIMVNGILSAPTVLQQFGFDQPNVALLYFPFVILPVMIVPIVIFTHITDIMYLRKRIAESK